MCILYSEGFLSKKNQPFQLTVGMEQYLNTDGIKIIASCLREYGYGLNQDEMIQECLINVANALVTYDPSRVDCKLSSFVYTCCRNRIKMEWRKLSSEKSKVERHTLSYEALDEQIAPETLIMEDEALEDSVIRKDRLAWLRDVLDRPDTDLSEDEQRIIELTRLGYTQTEIAKIVGVSQSQVSIKKNSAINKLSIVLQQDRTQGKVRI